MDYSSHACPRCGKQLTEDAPIGSRCYNCEHGDPPPPSPAPAAQERVTRLTVVDDTGRVYEKWNVAVSLSYQDGGRTLKVFVNRPDLSPAGTAKEGD